MSARTACTLDCGAWASSGLLLTHLPPLFSPAAPPITQLHAPQLSDDALDGLTRELEGLHLPGAVVVFDMVELLRERDELWKMGAPQQHVEAPKTQPAEADVAEPAPESACSEEQRALMQTMRERLVTGKPYTERKSTFQARGGMSDSLQSRKELTWRLRRRT